MCLEASFDESCQPGGVWFAGTNPVLDGDNVNWTAGAAPWDPGNAEALRLGGILARQRGDVRLSLERLERATVAAPDDADAHSELGLSCLAAGDLHAAETAFRTALARDGDSLKALARKLSPNAMRLSRRGERMRCCWQLGGPCSSDWIAVPRRLRSWVRRSRRGPTMPPS